MSEITKVVHRLPTISRAFNNFLDSVLLSRALLLRLESKTVIAYRKLEQELIFDVDLLKEVIPLSPTGVWHPKRQIFNAASRIEQLLKASHLYQNQSTSFNVQKQQHLHTGQPSK